MQPWSIKPYLSVCMSICVSFRPDECEDILIIKPRDVKIGMKFAVYLADFNIYFEQTRLQWMDQVKKDLPALGVANWRRHAKSRGGWRETLRSAVTR